MPFKCTWEHLGAPRITVEQSGKTTSSSLRTLLVRLEIIATTNRSTIFKTHVFSLYSHLCIYVSIQLPIYTRTGCWRCLRAIRGAPENDDRMNSEIHSEAVIERVWRCNWRSRLNELRDALGGRDGVSLEMHLAARSSELRDAL